MKPSAVASSYMPFPLHHRPAPTALVLRVGTHVHRSLPVKPTLGTLVAPLV